VVDGNSDEITPIATAMARPGRAVAVGYSPVAVTMQSSGATAYVVSSISGTVTPLAAASGRTGSPISVGLYSYPPAWLWPVRPPWSWTLTRARSR